jgi:hypothetical protein
LFLPSYTFCQHGINCGSGADHDDDSMHCAWYLDRTTRDCLLQVSRRKLTVAVLRKSFVPHCPRRRDFTDFVAEFVSSVRTCEYAGRILESN